MDLPCLLGDHWEPCTEVQGNEIITTHWQGRGKVCNEFAVDILLKEQQERYEPCILGVTCLDFSGRFVYLEGHLELLCADLECRADLPHHVFLVFEELIFLGRKDKRKELCRLWSTKPEELFHPCNVRVICLSESFELLLGGLGDLDGIGGWLLLHHAQSLPCRLHVCLDGVHEDLDRAQPIAVRCGVEERHDDFIVTQWNLP